MPNSLTYSDLSTEIHQWPALPLSLSGDEVMPLDYRAGHTGWLLYGENLNKKKLAKFQRELGMPIVIVSAWYVDTYCVVHLAGRLPSKARRSSDILGLDIAPMSGLPTLRNPGLLVMDMDSTAIQIECIDEIAKLYGVGEQVSEVTEKAMRGELDFSASLKERVATLKGADVSILTQIRQQMPLTAGLEYLVHELHQMGWKIALASGGFTYFTDFLREKLQLMTAVANQLEVKEGKLTGRILGPTVDAEYKADTLKKLTKALELAQSQTIAVGDGANDLPMLKTAGLGIAYHAKPKVASQCKVNVRHANLMGILCILSSSLQHEK